MSLALNIGNWWECSGDEVWMINLRQSNFVAQGNKCKSCSGNQVLFANFGSFLTKYVSVYSQKIARKTLKIFILVHFQKFSLSLV